MGRTKEELKRSMSSREFSEWLAWSTHRPFGEEWEDLRTAFTIAKTMSPHVSEMPEPTTLFPPIAGRKRTPYKQSAEEQLFILKQALPGKK